MLAESPWRWVVLSFILLVLAGLLQLRVAAQAPIENSRGAPRGSEPTRQFPPNVRSLIEAFDRGDRLSTQPEFQQNKDLARLLRQILAAGNPWPNLPRREAAFGLEIVAIALASGDEAVQAEVPKLLDYYGAAARPPSTSPLDRRPPLADGFECGWHWGVIAVYEGAYRPVAALNFVARALIRCPAEPRFVLAQAVLTDQRWPIMSVVRDATPQLLPLNAAHGAEILDRYRAAMARSETNAEARVRAAWFLQRSLRLNEALALFDDSSLRAADPELRYIGELVRGRILRSLGQFDRATEAFRAAIAAWPGGQAARVALMTLVVAHGSRQEGESLAEAIQSTTDGGLDPWWWFWQGDYHLYRSIAARLHELAR